MALPRLGLTINSYHYKIYLAFESAGLNQEPDHELISKYQIKPLSHSGMITYFDKVVFQFVSYVLSFTIYRWSFTPFVGVHGQRYFIFPETPQFLERLYFCSWSAVCTISASGWNAKVGIFHNFFHKSYDVRFSGLSLRPNLVISLGQPLWNILIVGYCINL